MKKYFTHNGTEQQGPFDLEELKSHGIKKDTSVWYEGLGDWTKASEIDELKVLIAAQGPPAFKEATINQPPTVPEVSNSANTGSSKKSKGFGSAVLIGTIIGLVLVAIACVVFFKMINSDGGAGYEQESYEEKVMTIEEIERSQPLNFLSTTGTYRQTLLGNKFKLKCKIINSATVASYKDAILRVTYYSKTNTVLTTNDYTIYEVFPPTSSKTVDLKIENYKNVESIGWEVIQATVY